MVKRGFDSKQGDHNLIRYGTLCVQYHGSLRGLRSRIWPRAREKKVVWQRYTVVGSRRQRTKSSTLRATLHKRSVRYLGKHTHNTKNHMSFFHDGDIPSG